MMITDSELPKIIAQRSEGDVLSPISGIPVVVPVHGARHLDVDEVLARSLPKVAEDLEKAA
jgi:hypothetical protein